MKSLKWWLIKDTFHLSMGLVDITGALDTFIGLANLKLPITLIISAPRTQLSLWSTLHFELSVKDVTYLLLDRDVPQRNRQWAQSHRWANSMFLLGPALTAQGSTPVIRFCTNPYTTTHCFNSVIIFAASFHTCKVVHKISLVTLLWNWSMLENQ